MTNDTEQTLPEEAIDFNGMFKAYEESTEKAWKYDRRASLGASEVFQCIRKSFFEKWGYEQDDEHEDDWGAAKRGDIIENSFAVPALQAIIPKDSELLYAGEEQETLREGRLSATPDGLVTNVAKTALAQIGVDDILSDCFVAEFKSHDPRASISEEKAVHRGQVQVQMGLLHELTEYRPQYAVIFYFDASWLSKIKFYVVKFDPKIYEIAKQRSVIVFTDQEPDELPAEGFLDGTCNICKYTEECALVSEREVPDGISKIQDQESLDEFAELARKRSIADAAKKEAEEDLKEANKEIKDLLKKHDTKKANDPRFNVSLTWCKGKTSTDLLAMQADGVNVEDYQKEGNGYQMLRVSYKGEE